MKPKAHFSDGKDDQSQPIKVNRGESLTPKTIFCFLRNVLPGGESIILKIQGWESGTELHSLREAKQLPRCLLNAAPYCTEYSLTLHYSITLLP